MLPDVARTRAQVHKRLTGEINYWDTRYNELADADSAGRQLKIRPRLRCAAPATWRPG